MAQPKHRRGRDEAAKSPHRVELENLQKKSDGIVQKRNDLNAQAVQARSERDLLNGKRRELVEQMNQVKAERDAFNAQLREAKDLRTRYQTQAKELIAQKRSRFKKDPAKLRSPGLRAHELLAEMRDLEYAQQTRVLTTAQENELIKQLRHKAHEYEQIKREAAKVAKIEVDLTETDKAIDTLFAKAEEQHQRVLAFHKQSQGAHERFVKVVNEIGAVTAEANKHHKRFLEIRAQADEQHGQFLELREKMLELRGRDMADRREAREIIQQQHRQVRETIANPKKLDEYADQSLEQLKKSGKIRLG